MRSAKWCDINFNESSWCIPEEVSKTNQTHLIALSKQAIIILQSLKSRPPRGEYVFHNFKKSGPMVSRKFFNNALLELGYSGHDHTPHGFRASASTMLNAKGFKHELIEMSLSHLTGTAVTRAYNRYSYWDERVEMAQAWADYLDELRGKPIRDLSDVI